ncbi:MAG: VWA domain-containing protein [Phycisphaerae bacterium]|nr:VWA domain-containing protein [Phycisphaerae bacterium]
MHTIWDWLLNLKQARLAGGDMTFRLTNAWPTWLALIVTIAIVVGVIMIYMRDGGTPLGRGIGAALRCLLLVLLLLLIWQPVIRVEQTKWQSGVVAVVVDLSNSMSTPDLYGPDDPLVADLAAAEAARSPATSRPANDPAAMKDVVRQVSGKTRIDLVRESLERDSRSVIKALVANNDLAVYTFSKNATRQARLPQVTAENPAQADDKQAATVLATMAKDKAAGTATGVTQAVTHVLNELRGQRVAGVIVISDGRSTMDSDPDATVELANKWPVPIHTVSVGSIHPPRDLAVSRVTAEPVVFVKDLVAVKANIAQHGFTKPEPVTVRLMKVVNRDGKEEETEVTRQDVTVGEPALDENGKPIAGQGKREVETELRWQPDQPGKVNLRVRVEPPGGQDMNPANNTSVAQVDVKDAQIKVLLIEGLPRWEYRFVTHSLIREKTVTLSVMLMSADENFAQEGSPGAAITRLPVTKEEWNNYDVVIMGDVSPLDLTNAQMEQIEEFVRDRGGGFAMIAGEQFGPHRYYNTPIARLLPVEIDQNATPDRINRVSGYKMRVTHDGKLSPILRFEKLPEKNDATVAAFPDFYWFKPVLALKPGAEVLAEHPGATLASGEPAPLLVAGRYGSGKTYFSAVDDTWRWRWHTGTPFFDTYWLQLVRSLSRNKLLDTDRRFELSTDQTEYDSGQKVRILLQVLDRSLSNLPETIRIRVTDQAGNQLEDLVLQRSGWTYEGEYVPLREGDWAFQLDGSDVEARFGIAPGARKDQAMPRTQVHVSQSSQESKDLSIDTKEFPRLAIRTNGKNVTVAGLADLAKAIPDMGRGVNNDQDFRLWDSRLALFIFALLITAEWILRKKHNLQ